MLSTAFIFLLANCILIFFRLYPDIVLTRVFPSKLAIRTDEMASASGDNTIKKTVSKSADPQSSEFVSINLADPEDVLQKMGTLDLDDDETDDLLKQAYEVNRQLKKQLELGRLVMEQRMSSSKGRLNPSYSDIHQRPGSNMISIDMPAERALRREQTRMASATQSMHSRRGAGNIGLSNLVSKHDHPLKNYSYHSYVSDLFY